jgi:hypothetical protein
MSTDIEKFCVYRWHSVNIVPHGDAFDVCADDPPFRVIARVYSATIFGWIINVAIPTSQRRNGWSLPLLGPLWSRRRRCWYRALEDA